MSMIQEISQLPCKTASLGQALFEWSLFSHPRLGLWAPAFGRVQSQINVFTDKVQCH